MRRRDFVAGALAVPFAGFIRPESLPSRRAAFEEIGNSVMMTLAVPGLFRRGDREAVASIDSGFDTTLVFHLRAWRYGTRERVATVEREVKIRWDPWKKRYLVRTEMEKGATRREYDVREKALAAATTLSRIRLGSAESFVRSSGDQGPYYFVEVFALRNPLLRPEELVARRPSERSVGRDLEWFSSLVDVVAGERAVAEEVIHFRTNPFYLPPR